MKIFEAENSGLVSGNGGHETRDGGRQPFLPDLGTHAFGFGNLEPKEPLDDGDLLGVRSQFGADTIGDQGLQVLAGGNTLGVEPAPHQIEQGVVGNLLGVGVGETGDPIPLLGGELGFKFIDQTALAGAGFADNGANGPIPLRQSVRGFTKLGQLQPATHQTRLQPRFSANRYRAVLYPYHRIGLYHIRFTLDLLRRPGRKVKYARGLPIGFGTDQDGAGFGHVRKPRRQVDRIAGKLVGAILGAGIDRDHQAGVDTGMHAERLIFGHGLERL